MPRNYSFLEDLWVITLIERRVAPLHCSVMIFLDKRERWMLFCQIAASCFLTYICSFWHAALWFNQGLSSIKKLIHSLLCCKTTIQTYCGFMDCTGSSPETGCSFWRLLKSWGSYAFAILHSYFHCCLSVCSCYQASKNKFVTKTDHIFSNQRQVKKCVNWKRLVCGNLTKGWMILTWQRIKETAVLLRNNTTIDTSR